MNTDKIQELIDIMDKAELTALRVSDGKEKIELERTPAAGSINPAIAERAAALLGGVKAQHSEHVTPAETDEGDSVLVRSPVVGTFYIAPSPDEDPFVSVGQQVQKGQTLGIVEAMKMMNEIITDAPGTVIEVLAANGTQVEYDQPLFRISAE